MGVNFVGKGVADDVVMLFSLIFGTEASIANSISGI
jgi:hypothetical protein